MEPLGEGRNPSEEIKGWSAKKVWQPDLDHTACKCHISGDKLHTIGKTKKKKLVIWASEESDGDLYKLASRESEDKESSNESNKRLLKDGRGNYQVIPQKDNNDDDELVG